MRYIYKLSLALTAIVLLYSCGGETEEVQEEVQITGNAIYGDIEGADGQNVVLMVFEQGAERVIDSAIVIDGSFMVQTETKDLREYILIIGESEMPVILFLDQNTPEVHLKAALPGIGENYTVEEDGYNQDIKDYLLFLKEFYDFESELYGQLPSTGPNGEQYGMIDPSDTTKINEVMTKLDSVSFIQRDYAVDYITNDSTSPVGWLLLRELFPASGLLNFNIEDLNYFSMVANGMKFKYPNSSYPSLIESDIEGISAQVRELSAPAPEEGVAPEIILNDVNGQPIALSSLRGKVVLLDFWASWCGPCRKENPNVVRLYEKYKDQGFTIYSVSLDDNMDKWRKAIDDDNLSWPNHVSDLKGWQSEGAAIYDVQSIPATFLLDKEGNIIGENLRGIELERKLQEIFG